MIIRSLEESSVAVLSPAAEVGGVDRFGVVGREEGVDVFGVFPPAGVEVAEAMMVACGRNLLPEYSVI